MTVRPFARRLRIDLQRSLRPGFVAVGLLSAVVGTFYCVKTQILPYVQTHDYFALESVRVTSDTDGVSPAFLAETAGLYAGLTLWQLDVPAAEQALRRLDWVGEASVDLQLPGLAHVRVTSKQGVAAAVIDGTVREIAADGTLFRVPGSMGPVDLPYLTGWYPSDDEVSRRASLRRLLGILAEAQARGLAVSQVDVDEADMYRLFLDTPQVAVALGRRPPVQQVVGRLVDALDHLGERIEFASALDVSVPGRTVARAAVDQDIGTLKSAKDDTGSEAANG